MPGVVSNPLPLLRSLRLPSCRGVSMIRGRKTSRSVGDGRGVTSGSQASSNILTIRERRWCAKGHRCGNPSRAQARDTVRPRVMLAVVAPGFAAFPVICGESAEDSPVARGEHDTSDKNPDSSAAIWYTQHVQVWECRRAADTPQ